MAEKGVHAFPKGISPEMNVIVRLEFELAFYDVTVDHASHYATGNLPTWNLRLFFKNSWVKICKVFDELASKNEN